MAKKFFTYFDPPEKVVTVLDYETKFVDQSEADMVGLKYQLQRYGMDGLMARFEAMKDKFGYADTRTIPSFAELQNRIVKGVEYFNNLPSEIRAKFNHQPEKFYEYVEQNPEQAVKDGYISGVQIKDIQNISNLNQNVINADVVQPSVEPQTVETIQQTENVSA